MAGLTIDIGSLKLDLEFLIAWAAGFVILLLFTLDRFNEPANKEGSFAETLVPKDAADGPLYIRAYSIYVALLVILYTALSIVGPELFYAVNFDPSNPASTGFEPSNAGKIELSEAVSDPPKRTVPAWVPLAILLALTGASTQIKFLNYAELLVRRATHRIIGIPDGIERLARNIESLRINLTSLTPAEEALILSLGSTVLQRPAKSIADINEGIERNEPVRKWLRLLFLVDTIEKKDLGKNFDRTIFTSYKYAWEPVLSAVASLRKDDAISLLASKNISELGETDKERRRLILAKIDGSLQQLHALIAASIASKARDQRVVADALGALGLSASRIDPVDNRTVQNAILASLIFTFVTILVVTLVIRQDPLTAFQWALGAIALHGSAAFAAWKTWSARNAQNPGRAARWQAMHIRMKIIPTAQYLAVMLKGFLAAFTGLFLWWLFVFGLAGDLHNLFGQIWIPSYAVIGSLSSFWVAYSLDITHRDAQPAGTGRKALQVVMQALSTGFTGYFITITLASRYEQIQSSFAWEVAVLSALSGSILGIITMLLIKYEDGYMGALESQA